MLDSMIELFRDPSFWDMVGQASIWILLFSFLGLVVALVRNRGSKKEEIEETPRRQKKQRESEKEGIVLSDERPLEEETEEEPTDIVPSKTPQIVPSISVDGHEIDIPIQMHLRIKIGVGHVDQVSKKSTEKVSKESTETRKLNIVGEGPWGGKKKK